MLYIPASQGLVYKLLNPEQHERITNFFKLINESVFRDTLQIIRAELERIKIFLSQNHTNEVNLYNELIRPREDIIRYSENRVLLSTEPYKKLEYLFKDYVLNNSSNN